MTDELIGYFIIEARELVQSVADGLLILERTPAEPAATDAVFRALHTLKGSAGLFDFAPLSLVLHAAEDVMAAVRAGNAGPGAWPPLLDCSGVIENWIETIATTSRLPPDAEAQARHLARRLADHAGSIGTQPHAEAVSPPDWLPALLARTQAATVSGQRLTALRYVPDDDCFLRGDDPLALIGVLPDLRVVHLQRKNSSPDGSTNPFSCNLMIDAVSGASANEIAELLRFVRDQVVITTVDAVHAPTALADSGPVGGLRSVRVDAARVDALAGIAGELMIAKNALAHLATTTTALPPAFVRALAASRADVERLAGELDRAVVRLRSVKLEQTFRRLPRVLRETASRLGKAVRLDIDGAELEADKAIVDALYEPLLHLLRNAVDHGIETPAQRASAGKPSCGMVRLAAAREGAHIVITLTDDGGGIDPARVRRSAVTRGIIAAAEAPRLDDEASLELLFLPGFSTAGAVTDISGRGVGLDAVRRAIEALGGTVSVGGTLGLGATFRLKLPLAAAVTPIITVRVGDELFGIPFYDVAETIRVRRDDLSPLQQHRALVLRGRTLPVLSLARLLDLPPNLPRNNAAAEARILVVATRDHLTGLEVDEFAARMDVVLRPLAGLLAGLRGVLGTALLGDGRVLLVLNPADLAALSGQPSPGQLQGCRT